MNAVCEGSCACCCCWGCERDDDADAAVAKCLEGSAEGDAVANGAGAGTERPFVLSVLLLLLLEPTSCDLLLLPPTPPPNGSNSPPNEVDASPPSPAPVSIPEKSLRPFVGIPSPKVGGGGALRFCTGEGDAARKSISSAAPSAVAPSPPPPLPPPPFGAPGSFTTCRSGVEGRGRA